MIAGVVQGACAGKRYATERDGLSPATILEQGLRGITSVQAYNLQAIVGNDYSTALAPESKGNVRQGVIAGAVYGFSQAAIFFSFAIIFYVGSQMLVQQKVSFVEFFVPILSVMFGALGASQVSGRFP
jgi:ATP-binding cassette subfamily B (MDR/TAP) protein 1